MAWGESPTPSPRSSNIFPQVPTSRSRSPKKKPAFESRLKKGLKAGALGFLALSSLRGAGTRAKLHEMLAGHNAKNALMPYYGSTAVNVPLKGHMSYRGPNRMLMLNTSSQGPQKKSFFQRMFPSKPKRKISMRNLKLMQMAHTVRSGAGRRAMEVINVYTLPSTHNIISNPRLYNNNVVRAAKKAFQNGRKVFTNTNFERIPVFTESAYKAARALEEKGAKNLKKRYWSFK
jgi:hypothetical protein